MTTPIPPPRSRTAGRPVTRTVSVLSKRNTSLWKMVRSMLLPSQLVAVFASCGGGRGGATARRKRRLLKQNRGEAPLERNRNNGNATVAVGAVETVAVETAFRDLGLVENAQIHTVQVEIGTEVEAIPIGDVHTENVESAHVVPHVDSNLGEIQPTPPEEEGEEIIVRLRDKKKCASTSDLDSDKFHGWRKSSIDVNTEPPLTLKWIPSGLQIGDQVIWLSETQPERGVVRWIGKIRHQYYAGVEFERSIGNSSGLYGYGSGLVARLFTCDLGLGRFIPIDELVLHSDFHDKGIKAGFICIICRDDFLELPDAQGEDGHMVATKCGHLYHGTCLHGWFAAKNRRKGDGNGIQTQPCPHCQSPIHLEDIIRLFPAQV